MSKRTNIIREIDKRLKRAQEETTPIAIGGGTVLATPQHALDGPEHTEASAVAQKLSTEVHSGLLRPLSGDPDDRLAGDGTWTPDAGGSAADVTYDPTDSGLDATDAQAAIDETTARWRAALLRAVGHGIYLAAGHDRALTPVAPVILWSLDGKDFATLFGPLPTDNVSPTSYAGDPTITHWNGLWWLTHQYSTSTRTLFTLFSSPDLVTWTEVTEVSTGIGGIVETYPGSWARNEDGSVYVDPTDGRPRFVLTATTGSVGTGPFVPYEIHPTNDAMTTWSAAAALTGDWPSSIIDPFWIKHGDEWALWYKRNAAEQVTYATSATLTGTYVQQETGDWAGWGTKREAPSLVKLDDGRWRIYIQKYTTSTQGIFWSESDDDWSTWSALVQVTSDFADDLTLGGLDIIFIPGMYDHERDSGAHAALVASLATDAELASHAAAADPHTGYQKESEKGAVSGYAGLDSGGHVPVAQLGSGTPTGAKFLRDDQTFAVPGAAGTLDDLTDVAVAAPANAERLRYDAGAGLWKNSSRVWMPLTTIVGGVPELVWDSDGSLIPTEVAI